MQTLRLWGFGLRIVEGFWHRESLDGSAEGGHWKGEIVVLRDLPVEKLELQRESRRLLQKEIWFGRAIEELRLVDVSLLEDSRILMGLSESLLNSQVQSKVRYSPH